MLYFWILFNLFALGMLLLDLFVFHRSGRVVRSREALAWSAVWIGLAFAFAGLVFFWQGRQVALEFVTGYVLDQRRNGDRGQRLDSQSDLHSHPLAVSRLDRNG